MAAANTSPKTLQDAILHYADLDVCQAELVAARWPDGVECPTCGRTDVSYLANQRRWQCKGKHPKKQFSVKVGTIFEDSPIKLSSWFTAIWLIASAKNGISSYELGKAIGVTQKSAWFMLHRIRYAMQTKSFNKIGGEIEIDETFIGGKARNMSASKRRRLDVSMNNPMIGKVAVMGLLARHGKDGHSEVRWQVIPTNRKRHVKPVIEEHVQPGATITHNALQCGHVRGRQLHIASQTPRPRPQGRDRRRTEAGRTERRPPQD